MTLTVLLITALFSQHALFSADAHPDGDFIQSETVDAPDQVERPATHDIGPSGRYIPQTTPAAATPPTTALTSAAPLPARHTPCVGESGASLPAAATAPRHTSFATHSLGGSGRYGGSATSFAATSPAAAPNPTARPTTHDIGHSGGYGAPDTSAAAAAASPVADPSIDETRALIARSSTTELAEFASEAFGAYRGIERSDKHALVARSAERAIDRITIALGRAAYEAAQQGERARVVDELVSSAIRYGVPPVIAEGRSIPKTGEQYKRATNADAFIDINVINLFILRLYLKAFLRIALSKRTNTVLQEAITSAVRLLSQNLREFDVSLLISAEEARDTIAGILDQLCMSEVIRNVFNLRDISPTQVHEISKIFEGALRATNDPGRLLCLAVVYNWVGHLLLTHYHIPVTFSQQIIAKYLRALVSIGWASSEINELLKLNELTE